MKKLFFVIVSIAVCSGLFAQTYDAREQVAANYDKAAGVEGPYRFDAPALTASPKGYEPFYISHYGRHGSRYSWTDATYNDILEVLEAAKKADAFTALGQQLYDKYMDFYLVPLMNTGDLSELGWEQHTKIAAKVVADFPEIFKDGGKFVARASTSQRAIVSMSAFITSLQKNAPKADITCNSLHTNMLVINPPSAPKQISERYDRPKFPSSKVLNEQRAKHYDDILNRLFKDRSFLEELGGKANFVNTLYVFWQGYENYCEDGLFEDIFTKEEIVDFWEYESFNSFTSHSGNRFNTIPLLRDFVECADKAIETGEVQGDFRFGHDTVVNAIVPLLNLNGSGFIPEKAEDVKIWFQNYNCPMAANIQFVLYRSKKNPEILFKVLLNGAEATMPQLDAVSGPYYKWSDFQAWAKQLMAEHPQLPAQPSMSGMMGGMPRR